MSDFLLSLAWFLLFSGGALYLAYSRVSLIGSTAVMGGILLAYAVLGHWHPLWLLFLILAYGWLLVFPNFIDIRRERVTRPALDVYRTILPSMSDTEREALEAGSIWWDGQPVFWHARMGSPDELSGAEVIR